MCVCVCVHVSVCVHMLVCGDWPLFKILLALPKCHFWSQRKLAWKVLLHLYTAGGWSTEFQVSRGYRHLWSEKETACGETVIVWCNLNKLLLSECISAANKELRSSLSTCLDDIEKETEIP